MRTISIGETDVNKLKAYFSLKELDGITPALNEAGGQPQVSINGNLYNDTGIGTLISVGFGDYYALLTSNIITTEGDIIRARYKSGSTLESNHETFLVSGTLLNTNYITSVPSNNSYGTIIEADEFFRNRLSSDLWFDSSPDDRRKALIQATQRIDRLNFAGDKVNTNQYLQFPRKNTFYTNSIDYNTTEDILIPNEIKFANFLLAFKLLDGVEIDAEVENLTKTSNYFHQARSNYDRSFAQEHTRNGIPSFEAWTYLKPFLRSPQDIQLVRIG